MQDLWDDEVADKLDDELALRVYSSRLLGQNPDLVLHGGGNTSVKIETSNIFGEPESLLYVKGSGWDLQTIERAGFAPVRMSHLLRLAQLNDMTDTQMVNELKTAMTDASAPTPSVETILHALLPYKYVDHTHADAIISITNMPDGEERIRRIYGKRVVIIPYIMPGFDLAKLCRQQFALQKNEQTIGMVLLNHGIFSFADDARTSYQRMIELVTLAEEDIKKHPQQRRITTVDENSPDAAVLAGLRKQLSTIAGKPLLLKHHLNEQIRFFCQHPHLKRISQQGPATPDHVIRTKRLPLITNLKQDGETGFAQALDNYIKAYQSYFEQFHQPGQQMLDPLPRVLLDPHYGMFTLGFNSKEADIVADIYQHTMQIILNAEAMTSYQALPAKDIFDVEYWELEQAKLKRSPSTPLFQGEIALVTGGASGIGKACVEQLLELGAAVLVVDKNPVVLELFAQHPSCQGFCCDLTQSHAIRDMLLQLTRSFGGLDMLVLNAGIFPPARLLKDMDADYWQQVMQINLDVNREILSQTYDLLRCAPKNGRVAIVGSKNVPAPGPGAAAYSCSKAALNQLMRVLALEWGKDGIRINTVHPNAVFDTAIWSEEVLQSRAEHYQMSVQEYKRNNLLQTEISSGDVARLVMSLLGPAFSKTTAAQVPIDGGNERVV